MQRELQQNSMIEPEIVMNGFNDIHALTRLYESLKSIGVPDKKIHYFDGPFLEFPSELDYSDDGTLEFLAETEVDVINCGRLSHMDKQNKRFEHLREKEVILHFDCDEYVMGDWVSFCNALEKVREIQQRISYNIPWTDINKQYTGVLLRGRLFFDIKNLTVRGKHWHFYHEGRLLDSTKAPAVGGIHIFHDSSIRSNYREEQMAQFQKDYSPKEESEYCKANYIELPSNQIKCYPCGCTSGYAYYIELDPKPIKKGRWIDLRCKTHGGGNKPKKCGSCGSTRIEAFCGNCHTKNNLM